MEDKKDYHTLSPLGDQNAIDLVGNAVRCATPRSRGKKERWVAVMDVFACGSTLAWQLCKHYGFDPEEKVSR